jgi:hypothetical protein
MENYTDEKEIYFPFNLGISANSVFSPSLLRRIKPKIKTIKIGLTKKKPTSNFSET